MKPRSKVSEPDVAALLREAFTAEDPEAAWYLDLGEPRVVRVSHGTRSWIAWEASSQPHRNASTGTVKTMIAAASANHARLVSARTSSAIPRSTFHTRYAIATAVRTSVPTCRVLRLIEQGRRA